jgi:hypothetical protein
MPAVPGFKPPVKALCVVPQGMQEGSELLIEGRELGLLTGHPAEFRFYSSPVRSSDRCPAVHLRRFVPDSSLEGDGFEPSVPQKNNPFWLPALGPAIRLPQQKPALSRRDRWFESAFLQG